MDLVDWVLSLPPSESVLVLAHPGSGTQWTVEQLRAAGIATAHEYIRPYDPPARVLVTYRKWGPQEHDHVVHLVRDPLRVVASAAALVTKRPKLKLEIAAYVIGDGLRANVESWAEIPAVPTMAHTLAELNARAEWRAKALFRVEDIHERTDAGRNSHSRGEVLNWSWLRREAPDADALEAQARRYGYPC